MRFDQKNSESLAMLLNSISVFCGLIALVSFTPGSYANQIGTTQDMLIKCIAIEIVMRIIGMLIGPIMVLILLINRKVNKSLDNSKLYSATLLFCLINITIFAIPLLVLTNNVFFFTLFSADWAYLILILNIYNFMSVSKLFRK